MMRVKLCLAINLTSDSEKIITKKIGEWRETKVPRFK